MTGAFAKPRSRVLLPILEMQEAVLVEMTRVAGREQDAVKKLCRVHRAFDSTQDLGRAVAAILAALVRPMSLQMVIAHEASVNGERLTPRSGPCELGVGHFSGYVEVRLDVICVILGIFWQWL